MTRYELTLILDPALGEEELAAAQDRLRRLVTDRSGTLESAEAQGRRRLIYPIRKQRDGIFLLTRLDLPPQAVREVEASLRVDERVLRHLLVRA